MTGSTARSQRAHAADAMYDLFAHAPDVSAAGPPAHVQIEQWLMGLIDGGSAARLATSSRRRRTWRRSSASAG